MAGWIIRFVLFCVICCFLVNICEARGRGGGRGGRRYGGGGGGGGSAGDGEGGVSSGLILGIIFGVIGLITVLVVLYHVCKASVCSDSSAIKYRGTNGTVIMRQSSIISTSSQPPGIATPATTSRPRRFVSTTSTTSITPYVNSNEAFHNDDNHTTNADLPPSYESVVNQKEDAPPYSAQPNGNRSYPPASSRYPADPSGSSYVSRSPSDVLYPSRNPSAVSYSSSPSAVYHPSNASAVSYPSNPSAVSYSSNPPGNRFTADDVNGSRDVRTLTASRSSRGQGFVYISAAGTLV